MDKCKNFFEIYGRFWHKPSKRFASPDLVEPSFDSWRSITVNNFFMSIAVAEEVLKKKGIIVNRHNVLQQTRSHMNFFRTPNGKGTTALLGKKK